MIETKTETGTKVKLLSNKNGIQAVFDSPEVGEITATMLRWGTDHTGTGKIGAAGTTKINDKFTWVVLTIPKQDWDKIVREQKESLYDAWELAHFEKAKREGCEIKMYNFTETCNDKAKECTTDIVEVWANPDGTTVKTRNHTY